jgi:hypothetical protein
VRWSQVLLVGTVVVGCGSRQSEARLQRLQEDHRALMVQLEQLEDRLLVDQARVHFWREMQERHQSATAMACGNLQAHAENMAILAMRQEEQILSIRRLASRWPASP